MTAQTDIFYTRWTPDAGGPYPLRMSISEGGVESYELTRAPSKPPERFDTWKSLVAHLHGESFVNRHWTRDRYLHMGRHARPGGAPPGITVVGPLEAKKQIESLLVRSPARPHQLKGGITIVVKGAKGIDLEARGHEVAKLLYAGFHSWIYSAGYDFDDVLQEVYRKILVANQGRAPWDPRKSSFGHYVHLVCRSALSNFHRKQARISSKEQLGLPGEGPSGTWGMQGIDVANTNNRRYATASGGSVRNPVLDLQRYILRGPYATHRDAGLAAKLVPYIQEGYTLKEAAGKLSVERSAIGRAMKLLRTCAAAWGR